MDLPKTQPQSQVEHPAEALDRIPNKHRLTAIRAALPYLTKNEYAPVLLALVELCQPAAARAGNPDQPRTLIGHGVRTLAAAARPVTQPIARRLADRTDRAHNRVAREAQDLLITQWINLTPADRRLALTLDGVDWPTRVRAVLDQEPTHTASVAQLLADHAADHTMDRTVPLAPGMHGTASIPSGGRETQARPLDNATLRMMLASGNRDAAASAEAALLGRIRAGLDSKSQTQTAAAIHDAVAAALAALQTEDALDRAPLVRASLRLLDHPANDPNAGARSPIRAVLENPDDPAFGALRRALKRDPSPEVRRIAWRELAPGPLAIACLERLGNSRDPAEHNAVLENAHLIANPARRDLLASLGAPARRGKAKPGAARRDAALAPILPPETTPISAGAEVGLATLLAHADTRGSRDIGERLLTADEPRARLACARLAGTGDLADLTLDPDPAVALVATLRRSTAGVRTPGSRPDTRLPSEDRDPPRLRHTRLLTRSPHESVRRIARTDLDAAGLLDACGAPTVRAFTLARHDPGALAAELAALLDDRDTDRRVRAIRAAVRLRIADRWTDRLAEILATPAADSDEARVAATAAAALGSIPSRTTLRIVMDAIDRPDPRVRANAVESLEQISRAIDSPINRPDAQPAARLTEIKHSGEHRARANAVRALERLRLADASVTHADLAEILTDDRAPHRLAGAWLAERLLCDPRRVRGPGDADWQTAARCVANLAREEHDPHVRARAIRCARRLLDEINNPRRAQRDPAIDRAARRIRALADRHPTPDTLTGESATGVPPTGVPGAEPASAAGGHA